MRTSGNVTPIANNEQQPIMMNQTGGGMGEWMGGGIWLWAVIGLAVGVLLVVVLASLPKK
jgi:hypothetical protein